MSGKYMAKKKKNMTYREIFDILRKTLCKNAARVNNRK